MQIVILYWDDVKNIFVPVTSNILLHLPIQFAQTIEWYKTFFFSRKLIVVLSRWRTLGYIIE